MVKGPAAALLICLAFSTAGAQAKGKAPATPPVLDSLSLQPEVGVAGQALVQEAERGDALEREDVQVGQVRNLHGA